MGEVISMEQGSAELRERIAAVAAEHQFKLDEAAQLEAASGADVATAAVAISAA